MAFDIHPIVVHFPIALLFVYSLLKVLPFSKWFPQVSWRHVERVLLIVGVLGAFVALATGDAAKDFSRPDHATVELHETFAQLTTWLYCLLLLGEVVAFVNKRKYVAQPHIVKVLLMIENVLTQRFVAAVIALVALFALFMTGLLGGVMVYGTTADPLAKLLLPLFGIAV